MVALRRPDLELGKLSELNPSNWVLLLIKSSAGPSLFVVEMGERGCLTTPPPINPVGKESRNGTVF